MADYADIGGMPFKVSPEQQEALARSGSGQAQHTTPEAAQEGAQAIQDIQQAQEQYGSAGAFGMGAFSGLTLGLGPGIGSYLGAFDPNMVGALEGSGEYIAGDVAGMILPSLATGGEAAGARGLLGSALQATPAGLMGRLGTASERLALKVLPGSGTIARTAVSMAARGATDGALINLGHTIGDSLIQNKPLTAEALWAAGTDGALAGGLMGGSLGLVGGIGSTLVGRLPGAVSGAADGTFGRASQAAMAKRLGMSVEEVQTRTADGTLRDVLKRGRELLTEEGSGVTYGSKSGAIREAYSRSSKISQLARDSVVETLDKQAALDVPRLGRTFARMDTEILSPAAGRMGERETGLWLGRIKRDLEALEPHANLPGMPQGTNPGTWKAWVESRNFLQKAIKEGKYPTGVPVETAQKALRVIDTELEQAMRGAAEKIGEKGLAEKFLGAQLDMKLAQELHETIGKKAAQELLAHEATFTPRDISVLGGMALVGNPALAAGWAAAKGVGRRINAWAEPAMAEAAFQRSIGARAAAAEQKATLHIRDSVRNFFRNTGKTVRYSAAAKRSEDYGKRTSRYDRKAYEEAVSRAEQLISSNHQAKIQELVQQLTQQSYASFAKSLWDTNQRAVQYMAMNMPPRRAAEALGSIRYQPKVHGLDMKEFKFLRVFDGTTNPFAVLDKIESGTMSIDEVKAMKYVYPELHAQVVQEAAGQIQEMKMNGEHLPMDKIVHLGVILDAPIDSMLESSRIRPIQASFIPPEPPPETAPPPMPMGIDPMLQTPLEQMTV